jgi:hypothetical protein
VSDPPDLPPFFVPGSVLIELPPWQGRAKIPGRAQTRRWLLGHAPLRSGLLDFGAPTR